MKDQIFKPLDSEEKELIESIENNEWIPVKDQKNLKEEAKLFAAATMKKDKRLNIRISARDLRNLKIKALEEGIPYQTLVSRVLHKYLAGKMKERT